MKNEIYTQIRSLTFKLIENSICINQNFPIRIGNEILWEGYKNLSFTLKDIAYTEVYNSLILNKDYNLLLFDGAVIQMKYKFRNKSISEHILIFYPNPNLEKFIDSPNDFEELNYGNKLFSRPLKSPFRL